MQAIELRDLLNELIERHGDGRILDTNYKNATFAALSFIGEPVCIIGFGLLLKPTEAEYDY